jgi:2-succinyl-5-enolpyruvyl-6-hydroxy-3-cyclohexene-1-carboxylate synthase
MDYGQQNLIWAYTLVDSLAQNGVRSVVISPGSRSTPLTLACIHHVKLRTWVLPDERSAAFFALGMTKITRRPSAIIATSGTAPANWYPAVIEAAQDAQPLILLSADRPEELQDCGENQTIDQARLFGYFTRAYYALPHADTTPKSLQRLGELVTRAVDRSHWPLPGPVQLNVPLREPLVPTETSPFNPSPPLSTPTVSYPCLSPRTEDITGLVEWISDKKGVIVCGRGHYPDNFPEALCELASRLSWPIFADPLSGLRFGPHDHSKVLGHYDTYLRSAVFCTAHQPERILRFGHVPTSKALQRYLSHIDPGATALMGIQGPWSDPTRSSGRVLHLSTLALCEQLGTAINQSIASGWCEAFLEEERRTAQRLQTLQDRPIEAEVLERLMILCPDRSVIFCGNSMVIRDMDSFLGGGNTALHLVGNRGASGIDGNVSTILGMAAVSDLPVIGLIGDLALYHDMNGLLAANGLSAVLVVFNNGGGAIFEYLPQAKLSDFEQYWLTPPALDIAHIAQLYGLRHHRIRNADQFEKALLASLSKTGVDLIEVLVDRKESVRRHKAYWKAVV